MNKKILYASISFTFLSPVPSSHSITTISSQRTQGCQSPMQKSLLAHSMDREEDCAAGQTNTSAILWKQDTLDCHQDARQAWFKN